MHSPLVTFSEDLSEVLPCFAESYETSEDGLTITFKIPADAKFSNGDPLDAAAVKKSFDRFLLADYIYKVKTSIYIMADSGEINEIIL